MPATVIPTAPLMDLKPDGSLLDPHFDGYKLSLDALPIYRLGLDKAVSVVPLRDDQFTLQHVKAFGVQNHLFEDRWHQLVLYVDDSWNIRRHSTHTEPPYDAPEAVLQLPKPEPLSQNAQNVNVTLHCTSDKWLTVADGLGNLYLVHSVNRRDKAEWKIVSQFFPIVSDDPESSAVPFVILHSVQHSTDSDVEAAIEVLLLHVAKNKEADNERGCQYSTQLTWVTLTQERETWSVSRCRRLAGSCSPDFAALQTNPDSLVVAGSKPFSFTYDSMIPVQTKMEETSSDQSQRQEENWLPYVWTQTPEDVSVFFSLPPEVATDSVVYRLTGDSVELGLRDLRSRSSSPSEDGRGTESGSEVTLLNGQLGGLVDTGGSTWSITRDDTHNKLELHLEKGDGGAIWSEVVLGDANGRLVTDLEMVDAVSNRLAHGTSDQMKPEDTARRGVYNSQQLEECDVYQEEGATMARFHGDSHMTTHQVSLDGHQWLFSGQSDAASASFMCLRHDVDGLVWQVSPQSEDSGLPWSHVGTFNALGYVQASKQDRKFLGCSPSFSYAVIADCSRHVYIYRQPAAIHSPLRNRKTGRQVAAVAKQQLVTLDDTNPVLGLQAFSDKLFVLTERVLYVIRVNTDSE